MAGQAIVTIGDMQWEASLAVSPWELVQGLGGVPELAHGAGMLFDLGYEQLIIVTTEPMLFSLDIAFLSQTLAVTEVWHGIEPGQVLTSTAPARFFLEVNAGELDGIATGDQAAVELLPGQVLAAQTDWLPAAIGFFGVTVVSLLLAVLVGGLAREAFRPNAGRDIKREPLPLLPATRRKPTRYDVEVDSWVERDRIGIWITDTRTDKTVAEWWDENAQDMFEDGFFKPGDIRQQTIKGRAFEQSVLDYAESVGLLAKDSLPKTVKNAASSPARPIHSSKTEGDLEYLPDSQEFLAYTIDDIGYRGRIDDAFERAITRVQRSG